MLNRLPEHIDPLRLVEKKQGLSGTLPLSRMKRLAPLLVDTAGEAEINIQFGRDEAGQAVVDGEIKAVCQLQCQRCLEPMDFEVDARFKLAVVFSLAEVENISENYEPLMVGDSPLSLVEICEDEILLALPAVSMHPTDQCPAGELANSGHRREEVEAGYTEAAGFNEKRENPFAALADLKSKLRK